MELIERTREILGPVDRLEFALPMALFIAGGIWTAVVWLPESWSVAARVAVGVGIGFLSWMFPYLNRVLEGADPDEGPTTG